MVFPEPVTVLPPDEGDPWLFHDHRVAYQNPWISVTESRVTRPDGAPGIYGVVHYANRAVAVVPVDDEGCTWLVGQYRPTVGRYSWEVPEGGVRLDEDLVEGARRELLEETGLSASTYELVSRSFLSNSVTDEEAFVYVATGLTAGVAVPEGTERLRVLRIAVDDVLELIDRGDITDGFTLIAMAATDRWRRARYPFRPMRIYTKKGDDGTTGLYYGGRVRKDAPAPCAYGDVDEAQSVIGLARADAGRGSELDIMLIGLERDLWVLMADLATEAENRSKLIAGTSLVSQEMVDALEVLIDEVTTRFAPITEFVVPGQNRVAALLDVSRTVVRRAERSSLAAAADGSLVIAYLNRLSDLLWTLARWQDGESLRARG